MAECVILAPCRAKLKEKIALSCAFYSLKKLEFIEKHYKKVNVSKAGVKIIPNTSNEEVKSNSSN